MLENPILSKDLLEKDIYLKSKRCCFEDDFVQNSLFSVG